MAMIEVEHLQKNFVKTVKEPGLKGALRSFIHPEKQTFEAVKDLTFEVPKGQILGFILILIMLLGGFILVILGKDAGGYASIVVSIMLSIGSVIWNSMSKKEQEKEDEDM